MFSRKIVSLFCLLGLLVSGCSQMKPGPDPKPQVDWVQVSSSLETVTVVVTSLAFSNERVLQHKDDICNVAARAGAVLAAYDDRDLSLAFVRQVILDQVEKIENPMTREFVRSVVDLVIEHVYGYAWEQYADLIDRDEVRIAALLGEAISTGVNRVCAAAHTQVNHTFPQVYGVERPD